MNHAQERGTTTKKTKLRLGEDRQMTTEKAFYFKLDTIGFGSMDGSLNDKLRQKETKGFERLSLELLKKWNSWNFESKVVTNIVMAYFKEIDPRAILEVAYPQQIIVSLTVGGRKLAVNLHYQEY